MGDALVCPVCMGNTKVIDSRSTGDHSIRRRRKCVNGHRFTTFEVLSNEADQLDMLEKAEKELLAVADRLEKLSNHIRAAMKGKEQ